MKGYIGVYRVLGCREGVGCGRTLGCKGVGV